jgi:hypothetical protein
MAQFSTFQVDVVMIEKKQFVFIIHLASPIESTTLDVSCAGDP